MKILYGAGAMILVAVVIHGMIVIPATGPVLIVVCPLVTGVPFMDVTIPLKCAKHAVPDRATSLVNKDKPMKLEELRALLEDMAYEYYPDGIDVVLGEFQRLQEEIERLEYIVDNSGPFKGPERE